MGIIEALPIPILPLSIPPTPKPLQVYSRRSSMPTLDVPLAGTDQINTPSDSSPTPPASPTPVMPQPEEPTPPIAIRKGIRSSRNPHPIYNFLSYHRLSPSYYVFVSNLSTVPIPKSVSEAQAYPGWQQAMVEEMTALHANSTWELVPLPSGKSIVGCRWIYTVKVGPDGKIDRLKARLVAKGYTQVPGLDYGDTFSPIAKIASVCPLISLASMRH